MPLQDHVCHRLAIVKPDLHLDNPYLMDDVIAVVIFLLTGSMFQSSIPLVDLAPVANIPHQNPQHLTPFCPFQGAAQPTIPIMLSIYLLLLRPKPTFPLVLHYCVTDVETQVTLLIPVTVEDLPMSFSPPFSLTTSSLMPFQTLPWT